MFSSTLPIALDDTLPACLTIRSQVSSQDAPNHTPEHVLKYTPNCTRWNTLSLLDYTLPSKLSRRSQVHSVYAPKYTSDYVLKYTPGHALQYAPNCTRWHTPNLLDCTLPSNLSRRSQIHSEYASMYTSEYVLKYTPEHALKDTSNCTRWRTPSLLDCTLPSTLSRGKTLPISLDYMLPGMVLGARSRDMLSCRGQAPGSGRREAGGWRREEGCGRRVAVAEIMTSVDIIV
jgi:hypothetical protein